MKFLLKKSGMDNTLKIEDCSIPVKIVKGKRNKSIRLTIDFSGLRVSVPYGVEEKRVLDVLDEKSDWILKYYKEFSLNKTLKRREWKTGEKIYFNGKEYEIQVYEEIKAKRTRIDFDGELFRVYLGDISKYKIKEDSIKEAFRKWFINAARKRIVQRLDYFCSLTGLNYNQVRIKEQKSLWGSCSRKRNLNFNWKIIMAPPKIQDYVILHEVCHLKYLNHSKEYWNFVGEFMPDYKECKKWLNKNGGVLSID